MPTEVTRLSERSEPKANEVEELPVREQNSVVFARQLLRIGAVRLRPREPFEWASGLRAPIYCDNRLTLAYPDVREAIASGFEEILSAEGLQPDVIAGTATAGIPHATLLAERLNKPLAYVRSKAKKHGRGNQIEGRVEQGQQVVLVEDLISTGGSSLAAVEALHSEGAGVMAVLAIFSYELPEAADAFGSAAVPLHTLSGFNALFEAARDAQPQDEALSEDDLHVLEEWRRDPKAWSAAAGGLNNDPPEAVVGKLLMERGQTLAVAESCTGGLMLDRFTNVIGASAYLRGGIVAYSNDIKEKELDVERAALEEHGAVSEAVARQMAQGARERLRADVGVATTGIAGPGGGSEAKPVGTVWIAVNDGEHAIAEQYTFGGDRRLNKEQFADAAFDKLREVLERKKVIHNG